MANYYFNRKSVINISNDIIDSKYYELVNKKYMPIFLSPF